jgi:hypothetical protein
VIVFEFVQDSNVLSCGREEIRVDCPSFGADLGVRATVNMQRVNMAQLLTHQHLLAYRNKTQDLPLCRGFGNPMLFSRLQNHNSSIYLHVNGSELRWLN